VDRLPSRRNRERIAPEQDRVIYLDSINPLLGKWFREDGGATVTDTGNSSAAMSHATTIVAGLGSSRFRSLADSVSNRLMGSGK